MQDLSSFKQIVIVLSEVFDKRRLVAVVFSVISIAIIAIGLQWPQTYESSTTLRWDSSQVIKPLLEGAAVTTAGKEQQDIAKEVIYSNKLIENLIRTAELDVTADGKRLTGREFEILKSGLRSQIVIDRGKDKILKISYKSTSPEEAYLVVSIISKLLIEEVTQNIKDEGYKAYKFIQSQVNEYEQKLNGINQSIADFRAANIEVQVGNSRSGSNRITAVSDKIEAVSLELREAKIQRDSLLEQLAIESQKSTAREVVQVRNQRLVELEGRLSQLRLSYTETYPDIVQLKEQIEYLKSLDELNSQPGAPTPSTGDTGTVRSQLFNVLKRQIADQETLIKTLDARKQDLEKRFDQEIERSSEFNFVASKLEKLGRDQSVTKQLYDKLLTKLESARVTLNLELESAGSMFKIQEPPVIPLLPQGLRFLHFAIASVILGLGVPIGLIVGLLLVDPRIRDGDSLETDNIAKVALLGQVPRYKTPQEFRREKFITAQAVIIVSLTLGLVSTASLMRYYEVI